MEGLSWRSNFGGQPGDQEPDEERTLREGELQWLQAVCVGVAGSGA